MNGYESPEKTAGQRAYETFWQENLPANIEATGWEGLSPIMRAAWESVVEARKEPE